MLETNPIIGCIRTVGMFLVKKVRFYKETVGGSVTMDDYMTFKVFRHVMIQPTKVYTKEKAVFIIRFKPADMGIEENIRFSKKPMMIFMGFKGFREKLWCVNDSGLCQGIYVWDTYEDALAYSKSVAVTFMTKRSEKESVSFQIIKESDLMQQIPFLLSL